MPFGLHYSVLPRTQHHSMHRSLPKGRDARAALQPSSFPRHFICMQYRELDVLHPFAWSNFIFVRNDETRTRGIWARETAHYFWRERESSIFIEEFWKKKRKEKTLLCSSCIVLTSLFPVLPNVAFLFIIPSFFSLHSFFISFFSLERSMERSSVSVCVCLHVPHVT